MSWHGLLSPKSYQHVYQLDQMVDWQEKLFASYSAARLCGEDVADQLQRIADHLKHLKAMRTQLFPDYEAKDTA